MKRVKNAGSIAPHVQPERGPAPERIPPAQGYPLSASLGIVLGAVLVLLIALYALYTGSLLTPGTVTLLCARFLQARAGNRLVALLLAGIALFIAGYSVYGLRRGGMRSILPSRYGLRDFSFYRGLPMGVLLLAYVVLIAYLLGEAGTLVFRDPVTVSRTMRWLNIHNLPLFSSVALMVAATVMAREK